MARIRTIKPEFWTDSTMVQLSPYARLFFIGMWNFACDRGHLTGDAMALKLRILPVDQVDPAELIEELVAAGRVDRITTEDGRPGLWVRRFMDHQKVDVRWQSRCPYCSNSANPGETPRHSRESEGATPRLPDTRPRSGKEWSGKESKTSSSDPAPPDHDDEPESQPSSRPEVERLCQRLADKIHARRRAVGSKKPKPVITQKWRLAAQRLLDLDGCTESQVAKAIDWCQQDEFWSPNIESMPKLREQFDRLRADAVKRPAGRVVPMTPREPPILERDRLEATAENWGLNFGGGSG